MYKILTIVTFSLLLSNAAFSHSGRTDSSGCHYDHQNGGYHCHRSDKSITTTRTRAPASIHKKKIAKKFKKNSSL
jgi:hypothetical protein